MSELVEVSLSWSPDEKKKITATYNVITNKINNNPSLGMKFHNIFHLLHEAIPTSKKVDKTSPKNL